MADPHALDVLNKGPLWLSLFPEKGVKLDGSFYIKAVSERKSVPSLNRIVVSPSREGCCVDACIPEDYDGTWRYKLHDTKQILFYTGDELYPELMIKYRLEQA